MVPFIVERPMNGTFIGLVARSGSGGLAAGRGVRAAESWLVAGGELRGLGAGADLGLEGG